MLKGDLTSTPLAPLLVQLAEEAATGCLHISDPEGDEALIFFKSGLVYAVSVPGRRPQLGAKLISSGDLAPEALADALEAQRSELQGWRLGELLVHLGYVDQPVVEAFVKEQVHDALWDLIRWSEGRWRFRKNEKTREDVAPPMQVTELLADLRDRGDNWEAISAIVHGPTAVPVLSARGGGAPETTLDADAWSMLCKIDNERSVAELARDCGYTLFEAGQVLVKLVQAGLVDIEEDLDVTPAAAIAAVPAQAEAAADDDLYGATSVISALSAAAADAAEAEVAPPATDVDAAPSEGDGDDAFAALARLVTEVAAHVREEDQAEHAEPSANGGIAIRGTATRGFEPIDDLPSPVPLHPMVDEQSFAASVARVSEALADILGPSPDTHDPFEVPADMRVRKAARPLENVIDRSPEAQRRERLRAAAAAELAAAHALAESLRAAAQEAQPDADIVDLDQVRRDAERVAGEEAARVAAEEEAARVAAEEEAARLAAEEEAARLEAERIAAEEEAARVAAEEEAARLEGERIAAEEEAARVAAEEEAARLEAERVAAEEEAARLAAAAAEEEAARVAAEEEAARLAAEEEAARLEAEEEAARVAVEEEAARLVAERDEAEEEAWEEYWRREADLAAEAAQAAEAAEADDVESADDTDPVTLEFDVPRLEPDDMELEATRREAARSEMASATALLVELSAQAVDVPVQPTPVDAPDDVADDDEDEQQVAVSVGAPMFEMTDTAALLRELSSLGVEDDAPSAPAPAPRSPSRPSTPTIDPKKKKRGLFGR
jgi:hypothetical protein